MNPTVFDSVEHSVFSLEEMVERMKAGITTEVRGRSYTTKIAYEEWVDGVGDRAAWSTRPQQLSVAAHRSILHVAVNVADDTSANRDLAAEIAGAVVTAMR